MSANDEPEFSKYQRELDEAFHRRDDPCPAGTPEHAELLAFVAKLAKFRRSRSDDLPSSCAAVWVIGEGLAMAHGSSTL